MKTAMHGRLSKYMGVLRVSVQTALTYRANLAISFLFYAMFLFVFFNLWRAIYSGGGVKGMTFQQMIWYLCITELISYGARVRQDISNQVKSGEIAYQLIRPYSYVGFQLASCVGEILYRLIAFSGLALAIGFLMVGPIAGFQIWTLPLSLLSMLFGIAINFFSLMAIGLLAFRIEETSGVNLIYQKLVFMLGTFIPVEFLPRWLQIVAKNLPFSYVAWAPARLAVGFSWELFFQIIPMQVLWLAVSLGLTTMLYRSGIKKLQGMGG